MDPQVVHDLVKEAAVTIREQDAELKTLRNKLASYEGWERATALVERMESKGLGDNIEGRSVQEKVATILGSGKSLDVLEAAFELNQGQGGRQFAVDGNSRDSGNTAPYNAIELALLERHGSR